LRCNRLALRSRSLFLLVIPASMTNPPKKERPGG
jgi:hypothetical protein